jgi:predicted transcriptional regulator
MFDFLFKRATETSAVPTAPAASPEQDAATAATASRRDEQTQRASALNGNEAAAVALILESEFAGVRLSAAEHVQSQAALEQVLQAVRNTDRRVAKLMQGRLDAIRYQHAEQQKAQACLDLAQRLLADEKLTPNQVAELDRQWQVVAEVPTLAEAYVSARAALAARLEAQVSLQRTIIDAMAEVRKLPHAGLPAEEALQALERHVAAQADYQASPEHKALPRHLLSDFAAALDQARATLTAPPKPAAASAPAAADVNANVHADAHAGASAAEDAGAPAAEAAAGGEHTSAARPAKQPKAPKPAPKETDKKFLETMDALEAALEQGQLHAAAEHDKWLRDHKTRLNQTQTEHLNHIRAELKRLGDWARWGGNISREELVKAVEELPAQKLAMSELAKKVGSMRDRWKALDAVSGHAPKSLWERFDAACTSAYAPAAAHFKQLAGERHANAAKAQALISETQALAESVANDGADLKNVAAAGQRLRQMWGRLGTIDRKEKRKLDHTFDKVLANMLAPLSEQRKVEAAKREQLIVEAEALEPSDRHTLDKLRRLQERWQEQAKALPLERKTEQALWQRFRVACDAIFAKRKETAHAADHERKEHLHAREAICKQLEEATFSGDDKAQQAAIAKALKDAANAWNASGTVPRAAEARIGQRYHNAVGKVQAQADAIKRRAGAAQANALRDKLRLAQALESELASDASIDAAGWQARWAELPSLGNDYERALQGRFNAALAAVDGKRSAYAAQLESNRARLLDEILRLEIVAGVDSGAEFARERLKMQVEVLQSSLKSGQKPQSASAAYLQLCAMPALADARTASRIEQLFRRIGASERA